MISKNRGGMLGEIEDIEARIQARIGEFLGSKAKLLEMQKSSVLTIQSKATELLGSQVQLETALSDTITPMIDRAKQGSYSVSDILQGGAFYYQMDSQISDVDDLWNQYHGLAPQEAGIFSGTNILLLLGAGVLFYVFKKQRR